ncbi:hypothetical protein ACEQPO_18965 [Bacillus sp. SL00103]
MLNIVKRSVRWCDQERRENQTNGTKEYKERLFPFILQLLERLFFKKERLHTV